MNTMNSMGLNSIGSLAALAMVGAAACSSSSAGPTMATPDASESASDTGTNGEAMLTVMNFLSWCSVTINGGAASTGASVTASVASGSMVTLVATPASSSFMIGDNPWFGVTQNGGGAAPGMDNGTGTTETSTATVVVTGNQCVAVCCQEPNNGPTPCPATNPCP
jgi:hypothetical protein